MNFDIKPVTTKDELSKIVPLIQDYQRFYTQKAQSQEAIEAHFDPLREGGTGFQLFAEAVDGVALGFCTVYFLPSSTTCRMYACFNDLYVIPASRGTGAGRALLKAAARECARRGMSSMEWMTQKQNEVAQKLYDRLTKNKTEWFYYSIETSS